jgi:hypothetical protein
MKTSLSFVTILVLFFATSIPLFSQSTEESAGSVAEQAGKLREALTQYVAALQKTTEGSADNQRLRETIIKLVQRLSPPPAVPEEAERRMARGRAAVKAATDEQGFLRAANELQQALKAAPWLADGYFNLGVVLDKAGRHADAIRNLKLYMLAAPNAPDAKQVRDLMFEIEYRQEESQRAKAEAERKAAQQRQAEIEKRNRWFQQLAGRWATENIMGYCASKTEYQLTVNTSTSFTLKYVGSSNTKISSAPPNIGCNSHKTWVLWVLEGLVMDGREINGSLMRVMTFRDFPLEGCRSVSDVRLNDTPVTGSISEDGRTMTLRYTSPDVTITPICGLTGQSSSTEVVLKRGQ